MLFVCPLISSVLKCLIIMMSNKPLPGADPERGSEYRDVSLMQGVWGGTETNYKVFSPKSCLMQDLEHIQVNTRKHLTK